jgi:branched-chain amino acid transport system substrate-binding protein
VLGTSLSLTGSLGQFGIDLQAGYKQKISEINAAGGLSVAGIKRPVTLTVLDNRSDPNTASQQIRELVLKDSAVALLGACTPPINIPEALAAEQQKVPYLSTCNPVLAFQSGNANWKYAWDAFFSEQDQATMVAKALVMAKSNKKVALFTDTEPDGVAERPLYKQAFTAAGLQVVGDYTFPVGTTDFSSFINDAKSKGAQLMAAQMIPPDGIALWKQMKALSFKPVQELVSKAASNAGWPQALGALAEGTLGDAFWSPSTGLTNSAAVAAAVAGKVPGDLPDVGISVLAYTICAVVTDAIHTAGSTDGSAVSAAIGNTNADYPAGHISFGAKHTATTPYLVGQWQNGQDVVVAPTMAAGVTFEDPAKGLQ